MRRNIFLVASLFLTTTVFGQVQEQLSPTEKKQVTLVTEPLTLYKGFIRGGLASTYSVIDKIFLENGKRQSLPGNIWGNYFSVYTFVQYGVTDRFMVDVLVPYLMGNIYQSVLVEDAATGQTGIFEWDSPQTGLGDIDLTLGYQFITEEGKRPALGLFVVTTFPTGQKDITNVDSNNPNSHDRPPGNGAWAVNGTLRLRKVSYPFSYTVSAGYKLRLPGNKVVEPDGDAVDFKDPDYINFTSSFNMHLNDWIVFKNIADYYYFSEFTVEDEVITDKSWSFQYTPGLSFQLKRFRLDQAITLPVAGKLAAADPGYTIILQYTF